MKKIVLVLFILITPILVFYFFGSSSNWEEEQYYQLKNYDAVSERPKDTLTVMTYNVGYLSGMTNNRSVERSEELYSGNLLKAFSHINRLSPDILGLQEVDFEASRSYDYNQLDSLASASNYEWAYQSVNWDKRYVPFPYWPIKFHFGKVISGQGILSKYTVSDVDTEILLPPINLSFIQKAFYIDRLLQKVQITVGEKRIIVLNVHLEAFDAETREEQAKRIRTIYESYAENYPVLLIGDFNSQLPYDERYLSKAISILLTADDISPAVSEPQYHTGPEDYFTFSSEKPAYKIDHVFYNPSKIEIISSRVVDGIGTVSDHLPLMVKFKLIE